MKETYVKIIFKTEKVFQKMGETNKSISSLNYVFDLKKKVLFTKVFNKPFEWVVFFLLLLPFFIIFYLLFLYRSQRVIASAIYCVSYIARYCTQYTSWYKRLCSIQNCVKMSKTASAARCSQYSLIFFESNLVWFQSL